MKFKSFKLVVDDNPNLSEAIQNHAFKLDYGWRFSAKEKSVKYRNGCFIYFCEGGYLLSGNDPKTFDEFKEVELSVREFFVLTPEDVRLDPKMKHCVFHIEGKLHCCCGLTQDQIDRIKEVMNE